MHTVDRFGLLLSLQNRSRGLRANDDLSARGVFTYTLKTENFPENLGHCMPFKDVQWYELHLCFETCRAHLESNN